MNTETLRTFIAAAQIKNFTKTAEHLFIAQSTVTNRIFDLESEIGKPLFTRKHKQIELTEAGLQFLDYAKQLVDLETTALQTVRSSLSPDERLRIGTTNTIYECRLQHALRKWMKAKPLSTIILNIGHTTEMIESLKKGNLDMVFSFVSFYGDGYWCRPYYSEDLCLVSSPNTIASAWKSTTALSCPPMFAKVWAIPFCLQASYRIRPYPPAFASFPFWISHRQKSTRTALCDATDLFRPIGKTSFFAINPKQKSRSYMSGFSLSY